MWNLTTRQPIGESLRGDHPFCDLAFGSDGRTLITGNLGEVEFWDLGKGQRIGKPLETGHYVHPVAVSPDGRMFATAGGGVVLWDASTRKPIGSPLQGSGSMAFSPDGKTLAVRESDDRVRLVDVETGGACGEPLLTGGRSVYELVFSPDGRMLAAVAGIDTPGKSGVEIRNILLWELSGN